MLADFDLDLPGSLDEALGALAAAGAGAGPAAAAPLAGGTNLLVDIRGGRENPRRLVALDRVGGLRWLRSDGGAIAMGARTTVSDLLASDAIAAAAPALHEAARLFAGQMVRNAATVAGNIACGSPAADLVPPLLALDAELVLASAGGQRRVALADFHTGYKACVRRPDELITAIHCPPRPAGSANRFHKLARRHGDAITVVGVAVSLALAGGRCVAARIALGAVAPVPLRARGAEAMLQGATLDAAAIDAAARRAAAEARPIDDVRASAGYRREMVAVLVRRLLTQAWQAIG